MTLEEALANIAGAIENVDEFETEFDFIKGLGTPVKVEDSEEFKNLSAKYEELSSKYKARFIESLTQADNTQVIEDIDDKSEDEDIKVEDLDLSGVND